MNLSLLFRSRLQAAGDLGVTVLRNLENLVTTLTSWGQVEHNADGTHSAITADSAVIDVVSKGRYKNHKIAVWDAALAPKAGIIEGSSHYRVRDDPPVAFQDAGVILLVNTTGGAGGVPTVYAMDSVGRVSGEIVWFMYMNGNTGGGLNAQIITNATAAESRGYTEFVEDPLVRNARNLAQGRVLPVMYFDERESGFFPGTTARPRWYLGAGVT